MFIFAKPFETNQHDMSLNWNITSAVCLIPHPTDGKTTKFSRIFNSFHINALFHLPFFMSYSEYPIPIKFSNNSRYSIYKLFFWSFQHNFEANFQIAFVISNVFWKKLFLHSIYLVYVSKKSLNVSFCSSQNALY